MLILTNANVACLSLMFLHVAYVSPTENQSFLVHVTPYIIDDPVFLCHHDISYPYHCSYHLALAYAYIYSKGQSRSTGVGAVW